jgi:cellulose biosynthesis protein BcsQ
VLLVDSDPQGTASSLAASRPHSDYAAIELTQGRVFENIERFKNGAFDLIVVDVGGADSGLLRSAVIAAGLAGEKGILIVPVLAGQIDVWGAAQMMSVVSDANAITDIRSRFVLNMKNPNDRVNLTWEAVDALKEIAEHTPLMETSLCNRNDYKKTDDGRGVNEVSASSKASAEFNLFARAVFELIGIPTADKQDDADRMVIDEAEPDIESEPIMGAHNGN